MNLPLGWSPNILIIDEKNYTFYLKIARVLNIMKFINIDVPISNKYIT